MTAAKFAAKLITQEKAQNADLSNMLYCIILNEKFLL